MGGVGPDNRRMETDGFRYRRIVEIAEDPRWPFTERYLRHLVFHKRIPYTKVSGRVFIHEGDLAAVLEAGRVEAAS